MVMKDTWGDIVTADTKRWNWWRCIDGKLIAADMDWLTGSIAGMVNEVHGFPSHILDLPHLSLYALKFPYVDKEKKALVEKFVDAGKENDAEQEALLDKMIEEDEEASEYYFSRDVWGYQYLAFHWLLSATAPVECDAVFVHRYPDLLWLLGSINAATHV